MYTFSLSRHQLYYIIILNNLICDIISPRTAYLYLKERLWQDNTNSLKSHFWAELAR